VIISKCIPGDWQIGERINIIMLRMISFLEIRNWRKGDYIEMYSGRLADWRLEDCQPKKESPVITYHNFGMTMEISTVPKRRSSSS